LTYIPIMHDPHRESRLNESLELMFHGYRALTARPDRVLDARGLQRVHHRILYFVGRKPGISVGDLLDTLHVTKQALNAPLRQLQEMRLVDSSPSAKDGRARVLKLTPDGIRLERQLTGSQRKLLEQVFRSTGEQVEKGWRSAMEHLVEAAV
jgi:DNA-binding MarR family transcriptional regulator